MCALCLCRLALGRAFRHSPRPASDDTDTDTDTDTAHTRTPQHSERRRNTHTGNSLAAQDEVEQPREAAVELLAAQPVRPLRASVALLDDPGRAQYGEV